MVDQDQDQDQASILAISQFFLGRESRFYPLVARDPDRGPRFPLPRADSRISLPALDFLKILNRFLVIVDLEKRALTMQ